MNPDKRYIVITVILIILLLSLAIRVWGALPPPAAGLLRSHPTVRPL